MPLLRAPSGRCMAWWAFHSLGRAPAASTQILNCAGANWEQTCGKTPSGEPFQGGLPFLGPSQQGQGLGKGGGWRNQWWVGPEMALVADELGLMGQSCCVGVLGLG